MTGNPVYPAAFGFWSGATFPETTLREYARHYGLGRALADALDVYLSWPLMHAVLGALGLATLAAALVARPGALLRPARYFAGGGLVLAAILFSMFLSQRSAQQNADTSNRNSTVTTPTSKTTPSPTPVTASPTSRACPRR